MARPIPIGVRGEAAETVELKHTLAGHHPDLPPVYSTPDMIRLMETASFRPCSRFVMREKSRSAFRSTWNTAQPAGSE
jgi:hypothetical protein